MTVRASARSDLAPIGNGIARLVAKAALAKVDELIADIEAGVMPQLVRQELEELVWSLVAALSGQRDLEAS